MRAGLRTLLAVLSVIAVAAILGGGGVAWYLFSGRWSVAASEPHFESVRWAIGRVRDASVERHASSVSLEALTDADVEAGGRLYAENCVRCHTAPGGERPGWVEGMRPVPPRLPEVGTAFETNEIAWLLRNGIKMTGMPAWGDVLSDSELLSLTAFVSELPDVSADRYAQMLQSGEKAGSGAREAEAEPAGRPEQSGGKTEPEANAAEGNEGTVPAAQAQADSDDTGPAATVEMTNALEYVPATVTIKIGDTIRWRNSSDVRHTVTADASLANDSSHVALPENAEPFNSGDIEPGGSWSHAFKVAGRYKYFCIPHEAAGMIAEVIVEE